MKRAQTLHHFGPRSVEREPSSPHPSSAAPNLREAHYLTAGLAAGGIVVAVLAYLAGLI
jgi:hypothetical protein